MPKKFYKYKLLLDEGFLLRKRLPILNSRFDVKHINADLKKTGLPDKLVFGLGIKLQRIIVTFNDKDFRRLAKQSKRTGVIGVSTNLTADAIDKKLTSLLMKSPKSGLYGKFNYVSGEK